MTSDQDRLEELLNRWEDLREEGQAVSEADLCSDCPELLPELRKRTAKLLEIGRFLKDGVPSDSDELTAAGRYRPIQLHAHGGLGEVFLARDEELGREVALKRIRSREAADRQRVKHFQFEAEITGRLDHPGVVPVYGLGRDVSGRLYYAMRFIRGETLQQALERFHRTYPPGEEAGARAIAFQKLIRSFLTVCQTIGYAHSQNVIHRDIKPANIMLGHYGETLVVDWGLAKRLPRRVGDDSDTVVLSGDTETAGDLTRLGDIKGSPAYMSPEQAEGRTDLVNARSDIYGLGATLYVVLAGKPPYSNEDIYKLLDNVKQGDVPPPRQVRGDIPPPLEAICLKAMSLKQGDRYATALEMAADLEHWLADDPVSAWREPWTARVQRVIRKHQTIASTLAAAAVVALLGISAVALQQHQSKQILADDIKKIDAAYQTVKAANAGKDKALAEKDKALGEKNDALLAKNKALNDAQTANKRENAAKIAAQKSAAEARRQLYPSLILAADRAMRAGDRAAAELDLVGAPVEYRNVEWRLLDRYSQGSKRTWSAHDGLIYSVARSPDGSRLAVADLNGPVQVYNVADGSLIETLDIYARKVAFLPDNDHLMIQGLCPANKPWSDYCESPSPMTNGPVQLWSISENKHALDYEMFVDDFALSPDGTCLAVTIVDWPDDADKGRPLTSQIRFFDVFKHSLLGSIENIPGQAAFIGFSPHGTRFYAVARQMSTLTGWAKSPPQKGFNTYNTPTWRSEFPTSGFRLLAWDLAGPLHLLQPVVDVASTDNADAGGMAITPDGKQVFISDRNRLSPAGLRTFAGPLFISGHIIAFDAMTGATLNSDLFPLDSPLGTVTGGKRERGRGKMSLFDGGVGAIAISDDGQRFAAAFSPRILVFDVKSRKRVAELSGHLGVPRCLAFDRNSEFLFSAGSDGQAKIWDIERPQYERIAVLSGTGRVGGGMAFSGDSRRMAVCNESGEIEVREVPGCRLVMKLPSLWAAAAEKMAAADKLAHLPGGSSPTYGNAAVATQIRFTPDGKRLIAVYENRLICVWDISAERPVLLDLLDEYTLNAEAPFTRLGVVRIVLSRDGRYLATESLYIRDRAYRVWDIEKRRLVLLYPKDIFLGWNPEMKFDESSKLFLLKRSYSHARPPVLAWDLSSGKRSNQGDMAQKFAATRETTPDGTRQVAVVDGLVQIVELETGRALIEYGEPDEYATAILSPDGNYILAGNFNRVDLLDASPAAGHR